ncbi:MAG: hypothetical protein V7K27_02875 [Nostoc sp.]|uniref:hypothetical protein n=1 Tax=Nostoc sp. TaxID=1180 RepID=UPI002FF6E64C
MIFVRAAWRSHNYLRRQGVETRLNDFNLNIPRYVDTFEEEEEINIAAVQQEIEGLEAELSEVRVKMSEYLKELDIYS